MTDHDDRDDRTWFRTHLDPVVSGDPPTADAPDPWRAISAQIATGSPIPAAIGSSDGRRPRRWLAVAASLLLVAGGAAVALKAGSNGDSRVTSGTPASETGWYAPPDLPEGWKVLSVTASRGGPTCAAWGTEWTRPGEGAVSLTYDRCIDRYQADADARHRTTTVLSGGITATGPWYLAGIEDRAGPRVLHWERDGGWTVRGVGITDEEAIAIANAAIADPHLAEIPVEGFDLLDRWARPDRKRSPTVEVQFVAPSGRLGSYELTLPGSLNSEAGWHLLDPHPVEGQPLDLVKVLEPPPVDGASGWSSERYRGRWPGADVAVHRIVREDRESEEITDADLEVLIGALRPVDSDQWQRFLDEVPKVSPGLRRAATLADVGAGGTRQPTDPSTTTTSATAETTTTPAPAPAKVTSEPGTARPNDTTAPNFTPLDGIEIRLELADATIGTDPVAATLVYRNTTEEDVELTECTRLKTTWALVPESEPDAPLPDHEVIDCYRTGRPDLAAGATMRVPLEWSPGGFVARSWATDRNGFDTYAGTLPAGRYLAVVDVPGAGSMIHIALPVTVPPPSCPMSDALALRWRGRPLGATTTEAETEGLHVVVVSDEQGEHPITKELDCTRLRASVGGGRVYEYTLG